MRTLRRIDHAHDSEHAMNVSIRPTVLVLGANGRFGLAAAQAFDAADWRVLAQVRRDARAQMPERALLLRTAVNDTTLLTAQAAGAQVVVHALNPPYTRWSQDALPLLGAGIGVAERLRARLLLPGNVYNYGKSMGLDTAEDAPQAPDTEHGRIRVELERRVAARCRNGTLRASILTAGDFFGGGTGSWFDRVIVKSIGSGKLVYPGPLDRPHAWAYLPDLAAAMTQLAARRTYEGAPAFERLHFRGHSLTGAQLLAALERAAQALGVQPEPGFRHGSLPWTLIGALGLLVPAWRAAARMSYLWRLPHSLDQTRLCRVLGTVPHTPLDLALAAALRALLPAHAPTALQRA
jgi:nucleoside-diphosphate-sugar epimerase